MIYYYHHQKHLNFLQDVVSHALKELLSKGNTKFPKQTFCSQRNITVCPFTENNSKVYLFCSNFNVSLFTKSLFWHTVLIIIFYELFKVDLSVSLVIDQLCHHIYTPGSTRYQWVKKNLLKKNIYSFFSWQWLYTTQWLRVEHRVFLSQFHNHITMYSMLIMALASLHK